MTPTAFCPPYWSSATQRNSPRLSELAGSDDLQAPPPRAQHGPRERGHARELFEQLSALPPGDSERLRIRSELVELHLPLVEYLARRFRNRGEWLDDLTQVATIGLIKSIDRFDLERGVEFSTYATPTIVGEIKRHFRDKGWAVRVPRRLQELKLALAKAIGELAQNLGRAPTVAELAEHLQMSEEEVLEGLESANAYSTVSLDAPDSGDDDAPAVAESLGMVDEALEGVEYRESLKPLLEQLPAAGEADPAAPVLRQHDPVADSYRARDLADARVPAAGEDAGAAPRRPDERGLDGSGQDLLIRPGVSTSMLAGVNSVPSPAIATHNGRNAPVKPT